MLKLLSMAWLQAKEMTKAMETLHSLYDLDGDVRDGIQLLQLLSDAEKWTKASGLSTSLLKKSLTDRQKGRVYIYQGIAKLKLEKRREAVVSFSKATSFKSSKNQAKSWISYIKQLENS